MQAGKDYYLIVDKKDTDFTGLTCNKIGAQYGAMYTMEDRCHRKEFT